MELKYDENNDAYIHITDEFRIRLEKEDLNYEDRKKAAEELRETPEIVKRGIEELRELIKAEPGFHVAEDDDAFLYKFLRPCKFYAESAFELMKRYYKFKIKNPKLCEGVLPNTERNVFEQSIISFLPKRDKEGRRIILVEIGKWKPSKCSLWDKFKAVQLALEAAMAEPRTQVNGAVAILDMQGLSLSHVWQFTPRFARMAAEWVQECVPIRLKGVHIINQPYIFNMLFAIFKPFLSAKLRNRIIFHGSDMKSFCSHIGEDALRPRYGGTMDAPEPPGALLCDLLCHYEDDYKIANTFGYITQCTVQG